MYIFNLEKKNKTYINELYVFYSKRKNQCNLINNG